MTTLSDHMTMPVSARSHAGSIMHTVNPNSQVGKVLLHLIKYGSLTQVIAHELYRVYRLASRITDLKHLGVAITANYKTDSTGTRYVEYSI